MRTLTPSSIARYVECPEKYNFIHNLKIFPIGYNQATSMGSGIHEGIQAIHAGNNAHAAAHSSMKQCLRDIKPHLDDIGFDIALAKAWRDKSKVFALLDAYECYYHGHLIKFTHVEHQFEPRPIVNPITGRKSRTFQLAGVTDGVFVCSGRPIIYELKSTSDSLKGAEHVLVKSLQPQFYMYMIGDCAGTVIDIVKKPKTAFRGKTKERKVAEPYEEYQTRCFMDYQKDPTKYFKQIRIPRHDGLIREAMMIAWRVAQAVRDSDKHGYMAVRGSHCLSKYGWCEYKNLCWYDQFENYCHGDYAHRELQLEI